MLLFEVIGNLGADARVEEANGRKFVSFSVADSQRWTDEQGNQHESVQWVSCAMDGDGGKLLPHLKKGRLIYVVGHGSTRVYSSPKTKRFESGANISVMRLELLGAQSDNVPSRLYTQDGEEVSIYKAYFVDAEKLKLFQLKKDAFATLQTPDGRQFLLNAAGWVVPKPVETANDNQQSADGSK